MYYDINKIDSDKKYNIKISERGFGQTYHLRQNLKCKDNKMGDNINDEEKRTCKNCYYESKKYEITIPLLTNEEIEKIEKTYNSYIEEVVKAVTHDKEMIILHTIIKEQKRRMDEIKELIKYASDCDSPTLGKILKILEE